MQPKALGLSIDTYAVASLAIFSIFFILITYLNRREDNRISKGIIEVLATTYDIEAAYDTIVNQVKEWRSNPYKPTRLSFASLKLRIPRFFIYRETRPRLYRVGDRYAGVLAFELTQIEGGGTSIKITYSPGSQVLIKELKSKLPIKVPSSIGKICLSCKRVFPPTYTHCPYCNIALPLV